MADAVIGGSLDWDDFDPLDVVMREDWGMLDIPAKLRGPMLKYALDLQQKVGRSGSGGSGASSRLTTAFLARKPQSLVKLIRNGGTSDLRGMRDQMDYLRKEGTVELERSDRYLGAVIDEEMEAHIRSFWEIADDGEGKADRTSHIVVSFPIETDHDVAYRAGRDWAKAMFASGDYGDHFDYYTAFHTDREHPHMHIVVNRRGLEEGDWLKISPRGHFDYDEMRFVQVRVASRHGIELEATPRAVRGIEERPYTDCEVQRAKRQGRNPLSRPHDVISQLRAKLHISIFARQIEADAGLIGKQYPDFTKAMREAARHLKEGIRLKSDGPQGMRIGSKEIAMLDAAIDKRRNAILENFIKVDEALANIDDGPDKIRFEREGAGIRAETSRFMPDQIDLRDYHRKSQSKIYQGVSDYDAYSKELATELSEQIMDLANQVGFDGEVFAARYEGHSVPKALADKWQQQEYQEIAGQLMKEGCAPNRTSRQAEEISQALHQSVKAMVARTKRELKAYEARKENLLANLKDGLIDNRDIAAQIKTIVTANQLGELERGNAATLSSITKSARQQHQLARTYLHDQLHHSDPSRRAELQKAIEQIDRSERDHQAQQRKNQARDRSKRGRADGGFGL